MKTPNRWLALIIAAHSLIGLLYAWATPMFEASDEGVHYGMIQWIVRGQGLPVQDRSKRETIYGQEGSQPPLYYWLAAAMTAWLPTRDFEQVFVQNPLSEVGYVGAAHNVNLYRPAPPTASGETARAVAVIRLFSLALSCVTVTLTYALARRLCADEVRPLLAAALVAFNPMAVFINAAVNNDNLLILLSTAALLLTLAVASSRAAPSWRSLAGLGMLLGLAALTKVSGLVLWPVAALALARGATMDHRWWVLDLNRLPSTVSRLCIVFGLALAVCGWWFVRNWLLYGEPLGLDTMVAIAGPRSIGLWDLVTQEWYGFYMSYWGIFGAFTLLPGVWAQWTFHTFTLAALVGGALALWRHRCRLTFGWLLLTTYCLLTLIGVIRWTMTTPASQGRLMFGAIAPLSLGMASALLAFFPARWTRRAALALGGWLAVVAAVIPIADIAPRYATPRPIAESALPAGLRPVRARLGDGIELVGYTADDTPRRPGQSQPMTLYWRALAPMDRDYALALVLFGRGTQSVGQIDTWPGAGRLPTSQWQPGALYADAYELPIKAEAAAPSLLNLGVGAWDGEPGNRLPIRIPDGTQLTMVMIPVGRLVSAQSVTASPQVADGATFEYDLTLLGYDVTAPAAGESGALSLTLYWRAGQALPADYTVFVHFVDDQGLEALPPADSPPLDGDWPTSAWVPGQVVADERLIPLPPGDVPPGCCSVQLGWYDPSSGARLLAFRPDGTSWSDNAVVLEHVIRR